MKLFSIQFNDLIITSSFHFKLLLISVFKLIFSLKGHWYHGRCQLIRRPSRAFEVHSEGNLVGRLLHLRCLLHPLPVNRVDLRSCLPQPRLSLHERARVLEAVCLHRSFGKLLFTKLIKAFFEILNIRSLNFFKEIESKVTLLNCFS
jgi:hypothetical protein